MKKGLAIPFLVIAIVVYVSVLREPSPARVEEVLLPPEEQPVVPEVPVTVSILPQSIIQGEPAFIQVENVTGTSPIKSITFNGGALPVFIQDGKPSALVGIDLRMATATYPVRAVLSDGRVIEGGLLVKARKTETAPLGIPETLGGNTPESEKELVNTLVEEGKIISAIKTSSEKLWSAPFGFPLSGPITITDVYGYSRETGASTIAHKGTDFRAAVGTRVNAISDGRVAYVGFLRNYGNVIAVDHGANVLSIYMHLSKVSLSVGEVVHKGEQVGLSGDTGYVLGAHLHLTVRINNISIDPLKFLELLGE